MAEVEVPKHEELEELKATSFTRGVALTTAIFAVALAIASLGGNNATKEMMLAQQQASDLWAFYQSKVIREHQYRIEKMRLEADLAERGAKMDHGARQSFDALLTTLLNEEKRYESEKHEIEEKAKEKEHERDLNRARDPYFDFAEVALQIAIVLSSISILATSRPIFFVSLTLALVGVFLMADGYTMWVAVPWLHGGP